jgi:ribosomal RNA-processing protein 36
MPPSTVLHQRVRARKDISDDEAISPSDASSAETDHSDAQGTDNDASEDDSEDPHDSDTPSQTSSPPADDPSTLSFGALARAQEALGKRHRPTDAHSPPHPHKPPLEASRSHQPRPPSHPPRPSKHAPQALSSKHAVSRHRTVIDAPTLTPRDPRFDPLTGPIDPNRFTQNYSFLSSYRTSEISALKTAIRAPKTPAEEKEKLQTALKRMESRRQAEEAREREREVVREHRRGERERVKEGKKPFFLKEGEVRKRVLVRRFEGMGERRRERVVERRRKKMAGREKKMMPRRRGVED